MSRRPGEGQKMRTWLKLVIPAALAAAAVEPGMFHPAAGNHVVRQMCPPRRLQHPADIELVVRTHAQGGAGVSVRVKVDDEGGDAGGQCRRRQSGGHGCLADTAFEAADAHYLHLKNQYLTPVAETGSCRLLRSSEPGRACATHPLIIC